MTSRESDNTEPKKADAMFTDEYFQLWVLLHQARDAAHKAREKEVTQYGLTAVQSAVLFVITSNGGETTTATIASWLLREAHTVSNVLARMESLGLITKTRNPEKKTELLIRLTPKGEETVERTADIALVRDILSVLDKDERELLGSYLKRVRDRAIKHLVVDKAVPYP